MSDSYFQNHESAQRILAEAWVMFQQKGFRGVSMDDLCSRCGVTKPTVYYYFKDKENLFVETLHQTLVGFHQLINQPGSIEERLVLFAASILDTFQTEYTVLLRDREHIKKAENLKRLRVSFHNEFLGPLQELMQSGMDQGVLDNGDPDMFALMFLGMINNFIGRAGEPQISHALLAQNITIYFLNGVRKK